MKYGKTIFLLIFLVLCPLALFGYGVSGHARQQLRLIATDLISEALSDSATHLNLPDLPLTLLDHESPMLKQQLDVLVAEGILERDSIVGESYRMGAAGSVLRTTSGARYYRQFGEESERQFGEESESVQFGEAVLERIGEVRLEARSEGNTQGIIHFQWKVVELKEWVWAPAYDNEPRLSRIKSSRQDPIPGKAVVEWQQDQWRLVAMELFLK